VINWDQTGVNVVPGSQWTQAEKGSSRVESAGVGDKCQITVTVAGTLSGKLLPFQVLYESKTERCHPSTAFPVGLDIWHTANHRANGAQASDLSRILFFHMSLQHTKNLDWAKSIWHWSLTLSKATKETRSNHFYKKHPFSGCS